MHGIGSNVTGVHVHVVVDMHYTIMSGEFPLLASLYTWAWNIAYSLISPIATIGKIQVHV